LLVADYYSGYYRERVVVRLPLSETDSFPPSLTGSAGQALEGREGGSFHSRHK
jgi:hypothetical protein